MLAGVLTNAVGPGAAATYTAGHWLCLRLAISLTTIVVNSFGLYKDRYEHRIRTYR